MMMAAAPAAGSMYETAAVLNTIAVAAQASSSWLPIILVDIAAVREMDSRIEFLFTPTRHCSLSGHTNNSPRCYIQLIFKKLSHAAEYRFPSMCHATWVRSMSLARAP